jgi:formylglycine-generating enzyme required for sulfatase activity
VQKEIRFALDVADEQPDGVIFIIPARLENCQVPTRIGRWQWVNLFEEKGNKLLEASLKHRANELGIILYLPFDFEPQMIRIPAGEFLMGSTKAQATQAIKDGADKTWVEREQPQRTVELSEYSIGRYPITNLEYRAFVRDTKFKPPYGWDGDHFPVEKDSHPVVNVSWEDTMAYCRWLSEKSGKVYRLPTEAEWEKAARSEDGRLYPWGNLFDPKRANTAETKIGDTSDVGSYSKLDAPNESGDSPYGCADMAGNVWEWCKDWFDEQEYKKRTEFKDPQGSQAGPYRVLRGGSFLEHLVNARCASRHLLYPSNVYYLIGFRVASSLSNIEKIYYKSENNLTM